MIFIENEYTDTDLLIIIVLFEKIRCKKELFNIITAAFDIVTNYITMVVMR